MKKIAFFNEIIPQYDTFVFDIWGVVHDGYRPFPKLRPTLEALREAHKQVIFLSNMSQPSSEVEQHLQAMEVPRDLYDCAYSSGQATLNYLTKRTQEKPLSCLHVNNDISFRKYFSQHPLFFVDTPHLADFLLVARGSLLSSFAQNTDVLKEAIARGLPLICANPDTSVVIEGKLHARTGSLAHTYEELGGTVISFGKPHPEIFEDIMQKIPHGSRIIMIGDSLETDIAGAQAHAWDTMLVLTGVTAHRYGWLYDLPTSEELTPLRKLRSPPTWVFKGFDGVKTHF
ncbi:MAG: TIGR01459 family HAD-type hydrolase [Alphaproteobacteria bacterium]|nr:MAG: TIGR01459 family HAD-type hydrolase [Alphaproteobacteria bacterium]